MYVTVEPNAFGVFLELVLRTQMLDFKTSERLKTINFRCIEIYWVSPMSYDGIPPDWLNVAVKDLSPCVFKAFVLTILLSTLCIL